MPMQCSICAHAERTAIELAVANRVPLRTIADQHGVSKSAIIRHRDHCGALAGVVDAVQRTDQTRRETVQARMEALQQRTMRLLRSAEAAGELRTALGAIREARGNLELLAKLTGELDERPQVNILLHPDWLALRERLLVALQVHPAALEAVIDAIGQPDP